MKEEIKLKNKIKTLLIFSAAFLSLAAAGFYFVAGESRFFDGGKESFADTVYYTVTFESNGGEEVAPVTVSRGTSILLPTIYKEGYLFVGWFAASDLSGTAQDWFYIPITSNTLYAKFINSYTVGLFAEGRPLTSLDVPIGEFADLPDISHDGYIFEGWFTDSAYSGFALQLPYKPVKDITLYGKLVKTSVITFEPLDGSDSFSMEVSAESAFMLPRLERDGYIFDGWYTDPGFVNKALWNYTATDDITLYAKWYKWCTITFMDGDVVVDSITTTVGTSILLSDVLSNRLDFDGWFPSRDFDGSPTDRFYIAWGDAVFYARWIALYTVDFDSDGGTPAPSKTVRADAYIDLPATAKSGYAFDGWYETQSFAGSALTSPYRPTRDITLYAKWTELYVVTFNANGGVTPPSQTVRADTAGITLPTTTRSGYDFDGWFASSALDGSVLTSPYTPTGNITLYAAWKNTVTFNSNGGSSINSQTVREGASITLPTTTRSGYDFDGWFTSSAFDGTALTSPYTPTGNITLYAAWKNTVTFDSNGGSSASSQTVREGASITLPTTTRSGYDFDGWFTSS
ncbi:MAG: InlB B-repeat-containing protein, partial [Clostridiales bacterium]|nr:InlB B-repeat-containing protein [Clostridiales bacterium]